MKKLPKILRPKYINDLIRLGNNMDGGYVLNSQMAEDCKNLISLGLGDNFSFEKELKKRNSKIK